MNRLKRIPLFLMAFIGLTIFISSCKSGAENHVASDGSVDLKLNFKPGDKFLYSTKIDQKIETIAAINQSVLMEMIYAYSGEEGGNKKLSITYDHIVMNITSPMGKMLFDSKDPQKREGGMGIMDSLIGKSFNILVSPDGNILKVDGLGELINSLSNSADNESKSQVADQFSDTAVKMMMQNSFDIYPGKPVKIGGSWVKKSQMGFSSVSVNVENTYVLKSIEGNKATISLSSIMNLPKSDMGTGRAGMQMEMNGKQEGTMEVDISTGQIISGKTTQDIKGSMTVEGMSQPMPINIKGDITVSSKKL